MKKKTVVQIINGRPQNHTVKIHYTDIVKSELRRSDRLVATCVDNLFYKLKQESPAVADKPARRLQKDFTVYVRAVGLAVCVIVACVKCIMFLL